MPPKKKPGFWDLTTEPRAPIPTLLRLGVEGTKTPKRPNDKNTMNRIRGKGRSMRDD